MKKFILSATLLVAFAFGYSQSTYYNDYTNTVNTMNWESVASSLVLNPTQKQQLLNLNNQYPTYDSWNKEYANHPERWSTDRDASMQRILGNDKYAKFKNKYYKGKNPVAVYNRNKHHDSRKKHLEYKSKQRNNSYKMMDYEKSKKRGDGSHLYVKGQENRQGKENGHGKGHGKGHK